MGGARSRCWCWRARFVWRSPDGLGRPRWRPAGAAVRGDRRALTVAAAKWLLVGRFRVAERPLWSSFVWRNELADTFVEVLAAPWLVGAS
jgi:hypothetical protein